MPDCPHCFHEHLVLLVRFWCPLSLVAALWGAACVFIPSTLNLEAPGSVAATLAAAAVGFRFHFTSRHAEAKARRKGSE